MSRSFVSSPESTRAAHKAENDELMNRFKQLQESYKLQTDAKIEKKIIQPTLGLDAIENAKKECETLRKEISILDERIDVYTAYFDRCQKFVTNLKKIDEEYQSLLLPPEQFIRGDSIDEIKHNIVHAMVDKINSLMSKADFNNNELKMERQTYFERLTGFNAFVRKCFASDDIVSAVAKIGPITCSICCAKQINRCLNPCGHTFCQDCTGRMNSRCAICRQSFTAAIRIFITNDTESPPEPVDVGMSFAEFNPSLDIREDQIINT